MTESVTKYIVTFTQLPTQLTIECDENTICDVLDGLTDEQINIVFDFILKQKLVCDDPWEFITYIFSEFEDVCTFIGIKRSLVFDEIDWMLDMIAHDPQLAEGFTHWGIQMEVME